MKCLASFVLLFLSLDTELEPTTGAPGVIFCSFLGGSWDAVADNLAASAESCFSCESSFHLVTKLKGKGTKCIRSKIFIPWPILYIIFRWPAQILTRKSVPRPCSSQFNASNHFYYRAWGSLLMLHGKCIIIWMISVLLCVNACLFLTAEVTEIKQKYMKFTLPKKINGISFLPFLSNQTETLWQEGKRMLWIKKQRRLSGKKSSHPQGESGKD